MIKSYKQFLELVRSLGIPTDNQIDREWVEETICTQWSLGGVMDEATPNEGDGATVLNSIDLVEAEVEPEFWGLDSILEVLAPNITLLQYKRLGKELVQAFSRIEKNGSFWISSQSNSHAYKVIELRELYNYLIKMEWIKARPVKVGERYFA